MPMGFSQIVLFMDFLLDLIGKEKGTNLFEVIGVRRNSYNGVCRSVFIPCTTQNKQNNGQIN